MDWNRAAIMLRLCGSIDLWLKSKLNANTWQLLPPVSRKQNKLDYCFNFAMLFAAVCN
jgi:hypothetical protein